MRSADTNPVTTAPWAAEPYSVKRHGVTITNCDSEPVQTPGCIQAHGALLVLYPDDLVIIQVSENSEALLGLQPEALLGRALGSVIGVEPEAQIKEFLDRGISDQNPLHVLTLPARASTAPLDVSVHTVNGVVVIELEATGRTLESEPDYYGLVKTTVGRLQSASSVADFCRIISEEVRAITGFDRVMVYKFHADGHGEVFAEHRSSKYPPWLGLHYPADDIPRPARDVFMQVWCRPLPDVAGALAELVPLVHPDSQKPLQMTHCALRGPSVMYTEYLANMRVTAGLTMPIRQNDTLWGLIACHHYEGTKAVPYQVRAACEFVAQVASLLLQSIDQRESLLYRLRLESVHNDLVAQAAHEGGLTAMLDGRPGLLDGLNADGAALYHHDKWWCTGATPSESELEALGVWLGTRPEIQASGRLYATDCLAQDYPPAAQFPLTASGLLAFPLARAGRDLMMWFRAETEHTIDWGGNPHDKPMTLGPNGPRLTPRASFELFRESVRGRSLPWLPVEVSAAARLRVLAMELVVGRAEHLAALNADLARSNEELDAFAYVASHDLKEPLRGIHKYAHQLLEDAAFATEEQRRKLESLVRLTLRMDGLLDSLLHFSRVGRVGLELELADLNEVLSEALEMVGARAGAAEVLVPRPLPCMSCDRVRTRELFVNLLSNALKYSDKADKVIHVGYFASGEGLPLPRAPIGVERQTILFVKDNGIGIPHKHFEQIFTMFRRLHGRNEYGGGTGAGLAIVKKLVERHGGQIWLDSTPGTGSTFYFTLSSNA
jgi:two-component system, chemotaxis family, sensor kinase Cph1